MALLLILFIFIELQLLVGHVQVDLRLGEFLAVEFLLEGAQRL